MRFLSVFTQHRPGEGQSYIVFMFFFPAFFSIFKNVTPTEMLIEYYCEYCILFTDC